MSSSNQLNEARRAWMASHVDDTQYPTPESQEGLALYLDSDAPLVHYASNKTSNIELTVYEVDCHPLTIRYARVVAMAWPEAQRGLIIEYLTQLDQDPEGLAKLFLGYVDQVPTVTAMVYGNETAYIITDLFGEHDLAKQAMYLHLQQSDSRTCLNAPQ
ncbi:hypothetical protein [Thaumasiovibrio subtropicus]|uniref:hypothetical protein n=1 Tax=Thaumasiovibrio subtropicus TaxID=1891207 RepID=UPI000B34F973|nr:hypothetical protein [Thaumasiovibrio subtropicus]